MYELMEDFEEVLSRAPKSITTAVAGGQEQPWLEMGGRINGGSSSGGMEVDNGGGGGGGGVLGSVHKSSQKQQGASDDAPVFSGANCLSSGCFYDTHSSSTESDTVPTQQQKEEDVEHQEPGQLMDQSPGHLSRSTSKYKKQRERLLSRPTL